MARAKQSLERNTFVAGLVTEASPLTFPENATIDEVNFVLNRDGSRFRRLGMDYENNYALVSSEKTDTNFPDSASASFRWDNVDNRSYLSFGVIQIGNYLWFLDLASSAPSANVMNGGQPFILNAANVGTLVSGNEPIQFSPINGVLVFASAEMEKPHYLEYDSVNDVISATEIDLKVRDIWGLDDNLTVEQRPTSLTDNHMYNLFNQGWPQRQYRDTGGTMALPHVHYKNQTSVYPANNAQWFLAQRVDGSTFAFDANHLDRLGLGNTPAAKGHFVINPFSRGPARDTAVTAASTNYNEDLESGRITAVAPFSGRVFYSGVLSRVSDGDSESPNFTGTIFFTQLITGNEELGKCYQEADPTAEDISDLVATDGGTINIPEAYNILRLAVVGTSLVVIAENGVWEIAGRDGVFQADDFLISKISSTGALGPHSVVAVEDSLLYWGDGGVYQLVRDPASTSLTATSITEKTIQTLYNDIGDTAKRFATGHYDKSTRKVSWLYNDGDDYDGISIRYNFDKELILDTVLGAWYPSTIGELDTNSPFIMGYLSTPGFVTTENTQQVVVNGQPVTVNGEEVVVTTSQRGKSFSQTKYVTAVYSFGVYYFTLSSYTNSDFLDWESADTVGVDAASFMVTGYELGGDTQRDKQIPYLTMHFNRTETGFEEVDGELEAINASGCQVQPQWDFADSAASGKFGSAFEAYRLRRNYVPTGANDTFDYGHRVITTKTRLRGSGRAISFRMFTVPGKDCQILGWGMLITGGSDV